MDELEGRGPGPRIGPVAEGLGLSPRMVRYLEAQGVLRPERGPGPGGHRHYPPPEVALARAAEQALGDGHPTATLRALREMADKRVALARADEDPLPWYELLAIARAVEVAVRPAAPGPAGPREPGPRAGGPDPTKPPRR